MTTLDLPATPTTQAPPRRRRRIVRCPRCYHQAHTTIPGLCGPCGAEAAFRLHAWRTRPARLAIAAHEAFGGLLAPLELLREEGPDGTL